ncbi:hypothetical protein Tco_1124353 [Tanacetum coccineum]|uniref:Uncharacterized protein n=1 Tax=Tanacetum coccineum TaxID=301880 RepID=A0ABQ5J8X3_9ASTR
MRQGWDPRYKIWVEHGEPAPPTPPPVIDNTRQPLMSDMTTLLNDLSYIPPNNEHNEPTQGDIVRQVTYTTQATLGKTITRLGKKVPKKDVLRNFTRSIPRLQRLYKSSHTAKDMIWHATGKCTEPGKMQHPVDGGAWKKFDTKYPDFAKEPRNVRLGLAADGFNPFGNLSQAYSMWGDIGRNIQSASMVMYEREFFYADVVLWDQKGVETIDVASGQKFNMRAWFYEPSKIFQLTVVLLGGVGKPHKLEARTREFNGQTDNRDPPKEFGRDVILAQLD